MISLTRRWALRAAGLAGAIVLLVVVARIIETRHGAPLGPWHTEAPEEMHRDVMDAADWRRWIAAEAEVFATVRRDVTDALAPADRVPANRWFAGSPVNPARFARDWNRSFVLEPQGAPLGAAVFLHGLTDAPYSLRHLAEGYRARGFVAIGMRMPGHGAVPAGLARAVWEDWMAATRLAMREARARAGEGRPVHLVGYSNGGALALKHALDAIEDPRLPRAEHVVLLSPMIGVTAFARFAGIAGLPSLLPRFARTAWLDVLPEFNPYKFNSFPVNAARQTHRLTAALHAQIDRLAAAGRLDALPPVLTFQSVVDATVSTPAVLSAFYARLPANGSEIVLFDLNRNAKFGPLFTASSETALDRILPPGPRAYATTIVTNASPGVNEAVARTTPAGSLEESSLPLGLSWPREVFSLSHVALPFPVRDGLYGLDPDPADAQGIQLGAIAIRGERGVLAIGLESLSRINANPFFPYLLERVTRDLPAR